MAVVPAQAGTTERHGVLSDGSPLARGRQLLSSVVIAMVSLACIGAAWLFSLGPAPLGERLAFSTVVLDRDGKLLRPYATREGRWRLPASREQVDPRFLELLLAYEDQRFAWHRGVDALALGRAFAQLITHGRIVSGASTLTMQVARLLEPRTERSITAKLRQVVRAIEIEHALSKDEILALYLSLAPYGGNLEGVRAASLAYFGKEPRRLTLGEAALLVALPQSPGAAPPRSLARRGAPCARPGARPRRRRRCGAARRDRPCQARAGAGGTQTDADAGAACRRRGGRRRARAEPPPPHHRCIAAGRSRAARARTRPCAGVRHLGRHPRRRACQRRGARPRRLGGLFRRRPRRTSRHDPSAPLAGLEPQAIHFRTWFRGWADSSRDPDRRPPRALRRLCTGEFRSHLSRARSACAVHCNSR